MNTAKKRKIISPEFEEESAPKILMTADEFREHLKEEETLSYIKDYFFKNQDDDNVTNYLKAGGSVAEIADSLSKIDFKQRKELTILLSALQLVVIRSIAEHPDEPKFKDSCKQFIANYMTILQSILISKTDLKLKKIVLTLLAAISVVHTTIANQILSSLTLSKEDLDHLATHIDPLDDQSLRVSLIHFLLSFVIDQNNKVIENLLAKKYWLSAIFQELKYDLPFTVQLVLSTIEEKIINNAYVSKTSKLIAFNAQSLYHLSELYNWKVKAWFDSNPQKTYTGNFTADELSEIRSSVHRLLLKITTSNKFGIVFHDPSYGTTNMQKNYALKNFLQRFGMTWEHDLQKELLQKILITSPDLIKPSLKLIETTLSKNSPKCLEIVGFITEVLNNINIELADQSEKECADIIQDIVVPKQILKSIKTGNLLTAKTKEMRLAIIKILSNMLTNYQSLFGKLKLVGNEYMKFRSIMSAYLINHLPSSVDLLIGLKEAYENKEEDLIHELIKLFILLDKLCPEMIDIIRYDDTITQWVKDEPVNSSSDVELSRYLDLVRLEILINPHNPYQSEFLDRFKWTTASKDESNKNIGLDILRELLDRSGLFMRSPTEMSLWIYCIEENLHEGIGPLVALGLKWAFENINSIYKTLIEAEEHSESKEVTDLNLDDFINLSLNDDVSGIDNTTSTSILHLSPLLPSLLHVLSEEGSQKTNDNFLVSFIVHQFHRQVSIIPYISFLKKYKCATLVKVLQYTESWLCKPAVPKMIPFSGSIFETAPKFILNGPSKNTSDITDIALKSQQAELLIEECLFISCELSRLGKATPERLDRIIYLVNHFIKQEGLNVNFNHPALLSDFHPLRKVKDSDLTPLVISVAEHAKVPDDFLAPFSHRLLFELKYAKKVVYKMEDTSGLLKLFQIFPFSQSNVADLIRYVFCMKTKYFEYKGQLSPWATVTKHLLSMATKYKIMIEEKLFTSLLKSLNSLVQGSFDVSEVCSELFNYLANVYDGDIHGVLLDSLSGLFYSLCSSTYWHEELCIYLLKYLDQVDYSHITVQRCITLIASLDKCTNHHSSVLDDSGGIIFKGLCDKPTPKWVSDLYKIESALSVETCKSICKKIKKHPLQVYMSMESLSALEMIFNKCDDIYTLYSIVISLVNDAMQHQNGAPLDQNNCEVQCELLIRLLQKNIDVSIIKCADKELTWDVLSKGLKLQSPPMIDLISSLVKNNLSGAQPGEIFELLCSHSSFLSTLNINAPVKYSTLGLLFELLSLDNTLIKADLVPVFLSSYNATLSRMDKKILKILWIYEKFGGVDLACWKPYVWGENAADHYCIESKISPSKANPLITIELLDKETVQRTITRYPINRGLEDDYDLDDEEIYDPAFYLPLLSQVVGEITIGWRIAGSGVIGLAIAALASLHENVRAAAYHILYRFYSSLKDHKDNLIWKNFIEALKEGVLNSAAGGNVRLCSIVTTFLARASIIMASPDDPLYLTIHNFIYAKSTLKLNNIPAFLEMFHSTQPYKKFQQRWILETLRDGIREQRDLQLVLNCLAFKMILDFYSSSLATPRVKELIESILVICLRLDKKQLLINKYSIITWIGCAKPQLIQDIPKNMNSQYLPLTEYIRTKS